MSLEVRDVRVSLPDLRPEVVDTEHLYVFPLVSVQVPHLKECVTQVKVIIVQFKVSHL